jgi:hypothetical protein
VAEQQELRRRIRELLVPGGEPIGEPSQSPGIQRVHGDLATAQSYYDRLKEMGEMEQVSSYPGGWMVRLGNEGRVGLRPVSRSGGPPAIDVGLQCVPEIRRIKFVQGAER